MQVAHFADYCPTGKFPNAIPEIDMSTMEKAIAVTEWYKYETQRILLTLRPDTVVAGDQEVAAILRHIQKRGEQGTFARKVAQNLSLYDGAGGTEQAERKLEEMTQKGLLITEDRKADNGTVVRFYFQSNTSYANNTYAIPENLENGVGENGVGDNTEEDFSGYFSADNPNRDANGEGADEDYDECDKEEKVVEYHKGSCNLCDSCRRYSYEQPIDDSDWLCKAGHPQGDVQECRDYVVDPLTIPYVTSG
jgi:hypothetical protein